MYYLHDMQMTLLHCSQVPPPPAVKGNNAHHGGLFLGPAAQQQVMVDENKNLVVSVDCNI